LRQKVITFVNGSADHAHLRRTLPLDKAHYDDCLCLVHLNKHQIQLGRNRKLNWNSNNSKLVRTSLDSASHAVQKIEKKH